MKKITTEDDVQVYLQIWDISGGRKSASFTSIPLFFAAARFLRGVLLTFSFIIRYINSAYNYIQSWLAS